MPNRLFPPEVNYRVMDLDPGFSSTFQPGIYPTAPNYASSGNSFSSTRPRVAGVPPVRPELLPQEYPSSGYGSPFQPITNSIGNAAANQAIGSEVGSFLPSASAALPYAGPALAAAAGAYGTYDLLKNHDERGDGRNVLQGGLSGFALGGPFGAVLGGGLGGFLGGKPHPETEDRSRALSQIDDLLKGLKTGSARDSNFYNVKNNTPETAEGQLVGSVNPLAEILVSRQEGDFNTPDNNKRRSDLAGMLANTVMRSKGDTGTVRELYGKAGLDRDKAYQAVLELRKAGQIESDSERDAYLAGIDKLFGIGGA